MGWHRHTRNNCAMLFLAAGAINLPVLPVSAADSQPPPARVVEQSGTVLYTKQGQNEIPASPAQLLNFGDRLRTLEGSRATVRFMEFTDFRVRELSEFEILASSATNSR